MRFQRQALMGLAVAMFAGSALAAPIIVDPVTAVDNGHYSPAPGADGTKTINGSGLSDAGASVTTGSSVPVSYPTTTAGPSAPSFFSNYAILTLNDDPSGPAIPTIIYTLVNNPTDPGYTLTGGHFWQYSGDREAAGERSLTSANVLVSSDNVTYVPAGSLIPRYVEGAYGSTDPGVDFSLTGAFANVKYVKLTNLLAPGDQDVRVAFNEIRFIATPEPASLGLFGMSALGLLARRRRV